MFETVKNHLNEVREIADRCPEKYQVKCFEILLDALVRGEAKVLSSAATPTGISGVEPNKAAEGFFSQHSISEDQWKRIFHFDGSKCAIIVNDLKDKTIAGKQIKLAILLGIENLLETGSPDIPKDILIDTCKKYACHDSANFSANMKKQKNLFLEKGKGKGKGWTLTVPGQDKATELILELAQ